MRNSSTNKYEGNAYPGNPYYSELNNINETVSKDNKTGCLCRSVDAWASTAALGTVVITYTPKTYNFDEKEITDHDA